MYIVCRFAQTNTPVITTKLCFSLWALSSFFLSFFRSFVCFLRVCSFEEEEDDDVNDDFGTTHASREQQSVILREEEEEEEEEK